MFLGIDLLFEVTYNAGSFSRFGFAFLFFALQFIHRLFNFFKGLKLHPNISDLFYSRRPAALQSDQLIVFKKVGERVFNENDAVYKLLNVHLMLHLNDERVYVRSVVPGQRVRKSAFYEIVDQLLYVLQEVGLFYILAFVH